MRNMSNHAHLITYVTGMWLLEPEVFINIVKGPEGRLEGRSLTTPTTAPSCASRTPISNKVLTSHRKSTGSPQTIPQNPHSFHKAKMHTTPSRPFRHTAHTRAYLIFGVWQSNTTSSQPHPLHTFLAFPPTPQSTQTHWCILPH